MTGARRVFALAALVALAIALVPVFQTNLLAPGDSYYFTNWDRHSQALVLGKIEQDRVGASASPFGLIATAPDPLSSYTTFDGLADGAEPTATGYAQYASSLGLQGYAFEAAYSAGCTSLGCLTTLESSAYSLVFVLFSTLLALAVRRSVGLVFLFCGLVSPWIVSSAHNLYWVPWTWLLPACAAAASIIAVRRRWRITWLVAVGLAAAIKSTTGYEFLTTTTLLAASIPLLALLIDGRGRPRDALRSSAAIAGACVVGFLVVLVIHIGVAGGGSFPDGFRFVLWDALRRTQGSPTLDADPLVNASLQASVFQVLARYVVGWSTALFAVGVGGPYPSISLGTGAFWGLLVGVGVGIAVEAARRPARGRRHALIALIGLAPPVSWLVIAKSHAFAETNETYVLWYLMFVPLLVWLIGDIVASSRLAQGFRAITPVARVSGGEP